MMHARDATGRQVSLLNDATENSSSNSASAGLKAQRPLPQRPLSYQHQHSHASLSRPSPASRSNSSSPNMNMPELLRSDSYDSQTSNDPLSPMTPSVLYPIAQDYAMEMDTSQPAPKRPSSFADSRTASFATEDEFSIAAPVSDRPVPGKRYPCRYRDSHGCEKTFTTSGHASRHSKIHTAEKAVQCTYPGCQKKFTRADNMKQHLETHYKDKSRASNGQRAHKAALAEARRNSVSGRSRSVARDAPVAVTSPWEQEGLQQYPLPTPPLVHNHSNGHNGNAWDMRGLNLPLLNRPVPTRAPSSGLDALAMAVAATENEATSPHARHGD